MALPRVLGSFDRDSISKSRGLGDREYWAWGVSDFPNATWQGAVHGLARLWVHDLWPWPTADDRMVSRLDQMVRVTQRITRKDGSLEEAFPREGSWCVTALVASDILNASAILGDRIPADTRRQWLAAVDPLIRHLLRYDEQHAFISNHLATGALALSLWSAASQDALAATRAKDIVDRIVAHQSSEGWFQEYEGADPGYQTLATYYLAQIHTQRPTWDLHEPLSRSVSFLVNFAHPDGSFGGIYGSRNTRFWAPGGLHLLAGEMPQAARLARFMRDAVRAQSVVTLASIDPPNLPPMLNAYVSAATMPLPDPAAESEGTLPCLQTDDHCRHFPLAGLLVHGSSRHYSIVSTHKGGVVYHFDKRGKHRIDAGVVVRGPGGEFGSTQGYDPNNQVSIREGAISIRARFTPVSKRLPTPLVTVGLRVASWSFFRARAIREWGKRRAVRLLIAGGRPWPAENTRTVRLGPDLHVSDETRTPAGYERVKITEPFTAIHMASQGYWQVSDEEMSP